MLDVRSLRHETSIKFLSVKGFGSLLTNRQEGVSFNDMVHFRQQQQQKNPLNWRDILRIFVYVQIVF